MFYCFCGESLIDRDSTERRGLKSSTSITVKRVTWILLVFILEVLALFEHSTGALSRLVKGAEIMHDSSSVCHQSGKHENVNLETRLESSKPSSESSYEC